MNKKKRNRRRLFRLAMMSLASASLTGSGLLAYAARVERHWVEVKQVSLPLRRLDEAFDGYRIVQISDIHAGKWMPTSLLEEVVVLVNQQMPDLVAVTGDFVTYTYHEAPLDIVPSM